MSDRDDYELELKEILETILQRLGLLGVSNSELLQRLGYDPEEDEKRRHYEKLTMYCQQCGARDGETVLESHRRMGLWSCDEAFAASFPPFEVSVTPLGCLCQDCQKKKGVIYYQYSPQTGELLS